MAEKEKLGVHVEPGTVACLRAMAGGERKVGEFLSTLTRWLWLQRAVLALGPLVNCRLQEGHPPLAPRPLDLIERRIAAIEKTLVEQAGVPAERFAGKQG